MQGIAGLAYNIADVPGLALTAEYRFTTDRRRTITITRSIFDRPVPRTRANLKTDGCITTPSWSGCVTHCSRRAAAAAAARLPRRSSPLPPEPARTYLVFFDWDRADLTARARQIVAEAAASQHARADHAHRSQRLHRSVRHRRLQPAPVGPPRPERGSRTGARRRDRSEISIHGYGESNPLVPTAKGVREPQNRRVEIILH